MIINFNRYLTNIDLSEIGEILEQLECDYVFNNDSKYLNMESENCIKKIWFKE